MKVKIYSTSSATNDSGAIILGLCPTDPGFLASSSANSFEFIPNTAYSSLTSNVDQTSVSGYPITSLIQTNSDPVSNATQGFNEFTSEDWTDTVPLKTGASVFWLPEDPSNMIFKSDRLRQTIMAQVNSSGVTAGQTVNKSEIMDPFVCLGLTGLSSSSAINVEVFLNFEYTVTAGASNVIETRPGAMNSVEQFSVVKRVGGNLDNTVVPTPEGSLWDKFKGGVWSASKTLAKGSLKLANGFLFGSSDLGNAVIDSLF